MKIVQVYPQANGVLSIVAEDGRGYFVEWDCGADLSADTIEARWQVVDKATTQTTARQETS